MHANGAQVFPLEMAAAIATMHVIIFLVPKLEIIVATAVQTLMFVGVVAIPKFHQTSAITLLMVGMIVVIIDTTIASIVATANMKIQASHAM